MVCRQSFECEDCDTKSNVEGDLNIHEETTHGDYSNDCLDSTHEDYYEFYGFLMNIAMRKLTPHPLYPDSLLDLSLLYRSELYPLPSLPRVSTRSVTTI